MKKRVITFLLILSLIATLCVTLVGCVGNKYDFSDFIEVDDDIFELTYTVDKKMYGSNIISTRQLAGCIYEVQYNYYGNTKYALYDVVKGQNIENYVDSVNVTSSLVSIVACEINGYYKYYLSDGQFLYRSSNLIQPKVERMSDKSYKISFSETDSYVTMIATKDNYGYKIVNGENFLTTNDKVGSFTDEEIKKRLEAIGLGKNYSIDIEGGCLYVLKNSKIVASLNMLGTAKPIAVNKASVLYYENKLLLDDSEDFNVLIDGKKYNFQIKSINLKNGKIKNIKTDYVINDIVKSGENGDMLVAMNKINKDKTLDSRVEYFVVNGKGIVANVNKSFAAIDDIYALSSKEFLVQTSKGLYLTDKYLNSKKDFTQVNLQDVFAKEKVIVASQTINGNTKFGALNTKGNVIIPFIYDDYYRIDNSMQFVNESMDNVVVYNANNMSNKFEYSDYEYMDEGLVCYEKKVVWAATCSTLLTYNNLYSFDYDTFFVGETSVCIFTIEYSSNGFTEKANIIKKSFKTEKNN